MAHREGKGLGAAYSDPSIWTIARTYDEFTDLIDHHFDEIDMISFDHDLACYDKSGNEMTGKNAADYVIDRCLDTGKPFPKSWYVHSDNTNGRQNIIGTITNYLTKVEHKDLSGFRNHHRGIADGHMAY